MDEVKLRPNDRICIGPASLFIYKNKQKEAEASMPDTDENPITHEFASDEVIEADNEGQKEEKEKMLKAQEEAAKRQQEEFNKKMEQEKAEADAKMKAMQD
jgi:hypothetical protein